MKIKSVTPLNDGMKRKDVEDMWERVVGFAGYAFNKSHSVEYTLISYQSMWLKTYYPVEFVAAALSSMKDERLPALLKDADRLGIEILYPDVNISTHEFEILTDTKLCIPFTNVKGISATCAQEIVKSRKDKAKGKFTSRADFEAKARSRVVNIGKIEALDKIGAFASVEPTTLPQRHPDRIKDQIELIPGLVTSIVPVGRAMATDKFTKARLVGLINEYREKHGPEGEGDGVPVAPTLGRSPRFMVVFDAPSRDEEGIGKVSYGKNFGYVADALAAAGLSRNDGYWTTLIKRPKEGRQVTNAEITTYGPYLAKEVELLKPPLIVLLGSQTVRHFIPSFKGKASEAAGKVVYSEALDANLLVGFTPGEIFHDPDKQLLLDDVFATVAHIID